MAKKRQRCKQCGGCCLDVQIGLSPRELKEQYKEWFNSKSNYSRQIYLLYPMLLYKYRGKNGRYHYRCKHVEQRKDKKWYCTIHDHKPTMCQDFPYYSGRKKVIMGDVPNQVSYIKGCGYNR